MKILFLHNNFPGQFRHLATALTSRAGFELAAIGGPTAKPLPPVRLVRYAPTAPDLDKVHPLARHFTRDTHRADAVLQAMRGLAKNSFDPDLIIGHPGWGECLPVRTAFPGARFVAYGEYFYAARGQDVGFDPLFPALTPPQEMLVRLRNASILFSLTEADAIYAPTEWQRALFPAPLRERIRVIHDGIDTDRVSPNPATAVTLDDGTRLTAADDVVTFVARNLEPMRGYHIFLQSLPRVLAARPHAHALIIGGDGVSYSPSPPAGTTWKQHFLDELAPRLDMSRVHFLGRVDYARYLSALQISAAHVYLTYPFVPSWSLVEAMSAGCLVIASDTAPVREFIDGSNGILTPFFDTDALAARILDAFADRPRFAAMRTRARATAVARYDLSRVCLPALLEFLELA